jgi:hypothetical protein
MLGNKKKVQVKKGQPGPRRGPVVKAPVAMNRSSRQSGRRVVIIKECERIATIVGSVLFSIVFDFALNPALVKAFPWLSQIATKYDRYRFRTVVIRYKNLKGTSSAGNVLMSYDVDTLDPLPTTAIQQSQSTVYEDGAVWRILELRIPVDAILRYTRSTDIFGPDLKTYDLGRVSIGMEGCADTSDHGYLEIEYEVELLDKQPDSTAPSDGSGSGLSYYVRSADQSITATADVDFNTAVVNADDQVSLSSGVFTLLKTGNWRVDWDIGADSITTANIRPLAVQFYVDGSISSPQMNSYFPNCQTGGTAERSTSAGSAYVHSDGSTTVKLVMFCEGTGGSFALDLNSCNITLQRLNGL